MKTIISMGMFGVGAAVIACSGSSSTDERAESALSGWQAGTCPQVCPTKKPPFDKLRRGADISRASDGAIRVQCFAGDPDTLTQVPCGCCDTPTPAQVVEQLYSEIEGLRTRCEAAESDAPGSSQPPGFDGGPAPATDAGPLPGLDAGQVPGIDGGK